MSTVRTPLDSGLRSLDLFFDSDALSSFFNRRVHTSHLRWKRGTSAVARLHDDDGVGWLAMYGTDASVKLEKTFRRASILELELEHFTLDDGVMAGGPISLDPRLYGPLRPFRREGIAVPTPDKRVLKYNPFRRVVFEVRADDATRLVCRVGAAGQSTTRRMLSDLAEEGVPVLVPLDSEQLPRSLPVGKHVEYLSWYGTGDLGALQLPDAQPAARSAGRALALLHAQAPIHQTHAWRAPAAHLRSLIRENAWLLPENRERLDRISAQLEGLLRVPGRAAVIHGDFSADQVLVDGPDVRLIDFERCTYGAAASDLGSFAAVEALEPGTEARGTDRRTVLALPRTAALLSGYGTGPATVQESEVLTWTAYYLLNRLREPFRACAPNWRRQMEHRLGMIEEVLW